MNPMDMMQIGSKIQTFNAQHPKFGAFIREAGPDAMREGSVLEMKVTSPEGKEYITNIKLTKEDIELMELLRSMRGGM